MSKHEESWFPDTGDRDLRDEPVASVLSGWESEGELSSSSFFLTRSRCKRSDKFIVFLFCSCQKVFLENCKKICTINFPHCVKRNPTESLKLSPIEETSWMEGGRSFRRSVRQNKCVCFTWCGRYWYFKRPRAAIDQLWRYWFITKYSSWRV